MILKLNNKSENFYNYLGRFFGSRIVQVTTQDRMYDDNNKEWYIYLQESSVTSIVSISNNKIKNIYTTNIDNLESLLNYIKAEINIFPSIVTNIYTKIYEKCNFKIENGNYKNFVRIWSDKIE